VKYEITKDRADDVAKKAMNRLAKDKLPPTPENFELWYCYYSNFNPEINRELDKVEGTNAEQYNIIYQKYLSDKKDEEAVRQAGDQIQQALEEIAAVLDTVKDSTAEYGENLSGVTDKIRGARSLDDLQDVVKNLVKDTRKMAEENRRLEDQISNSSVQVEELRRDLDSVRREAMTDGLTGLANRKNFDDGLRGAILHAMEEQVPLTLLMMDIDYFKQFNDNYGHQVGDQVLRLVGRSLTDGIKGRDTAARYGGEEFAIILPETQLKGGLIVAENLRRAVASKEIVNRTTNENLGQITISVGVAEYTPGEQMADLIERADAALYTAKHNGRNQVAAASSPDGEGGSNLPQKVTR